jgi:hypothetical protein
VSAPAVRGNRRLALLLGAVAVAAVALVLLLRAWGGEEEPPATKAAQLMPDATLVFAGVSTDGDREAVDRMADLAERFDAYEPNRDALLERLSGGEQDVDAGKDVAPWLGDEAAFALVDTGNETAGSLVAVEVTDEEKAREFLARNPREALRKGYKGQETVRYGQVTTAFVGGFLVIGQDPTVQSAIDRERGDGRSLDEDETYRRAVEDLPADRVVTAYASADGLRRLLAPQGSLLGGIATTLDQPGLQGVALAAGAEDDGRLRVVTHSALDPQQQGRGGFEPFEPALLDAVPGDALAYLGASGVSAALQRLVVSAVAGSGQGGEVTDLLSRLGRDLDEQTGGGLQDDLLGLFDGEVALVIQRSLPAPVLSIITRTEDEAATRRTLDGLRDPLAKLLRPSGDAELTWEAQDLDGTDAWTLTLPNGAQITYAVAEGRLMISTSPDGIRAIMSSDDSLEDADAFEEVLGERPDQVGTLGFLDFSQLLELGEQTGLNDSQAYLRSRDDLHKVRAIGVSSTSGEGESTAEILVSIP